MDVDAARGSEGSRQGVGRRSPRILIVDDAAQTREQLASLLSSDGYSVSPHSSQSLSIPSLLHRLEDERPDLLLNNVRLKRGADGISLLRETRMRWPDLPVVVYTRSGDERDEAEALRLGAGDYVVLSGQSHDALVVRNAVRTGLGGLRITLFASTKRAVPDRFIAASSQMRALVRQIHRVAPDDDSVLIIGETGTGKELVARALHAGCAREKGPLVAVNCGALTHGLAGAAFFGAARGAYTGADGDRCGFLEQARNGTLFLDEVGELAADLQPLLLRFLETGEYQRVGDPVTRHAHARVIAATNRDLRSDLARFRRDLFYRFPHVLRLLPLRERPADLEAFVIHWCSATNGGPEPLRVTSAALERLRAHHWPGNLRELDAVLKRARQLAFGQTINHEHVDCALRDVETTSDPGSLEPANDRRSKVGWGGGERRRARAAEGVAPPEPLAHRTHGFQPRHQSMDTSAQDAGPGPSVMTTVRVVHAGSNVHPMGARPAPSWAAVAPTWGTAQAALGPLC